VRKLGRKNPVWLQILYRLEYRTEKRLGNLERMENMKEM